MATAPPFASIGQATDKIDVRLSYRIIELFSEGLYASPNKAIEELVANSFDAGALTVQVLLSTSLHDQDATIAVIDDGGGMDADGLKQHWLIGISNKRRPGLKLPRGRQQIGKFGIGKLATYVLAGRLTHITKRGEKYFSTSMDFGAIDKRVGKEVEPKSPISIPLRELTEDEAKAAIAKWTDTAAFKASAMELFGEGAPDAWTVSVMSSLKPKVNEIKPGILRWVLRTALPLRPDFSIWLDGAKLAPTKKGKGMLKSWVLGKDITELPKPGPKGVKAAEDPEVEESSEHRFGLSVPGLGRVTGYAEAYRDLLTGKSDELGRSYGFFVYLFGRLVNVLDGHFGIPPNELRHGTFGRFRLVVHMDGLDKELRSNREAVSDGPLLSTAQDVLRAIFNAVRPTLEKHDEAEEPGARLARKLAASPASLSRRPIVELARAVVDGKRKSRYLIVPERATAEERGAFVDALEERASGEAEQFVTGLEIDYNATADGGLARYHTVTGQLLINAWHPFVATFHDEFTAKSARQPLELLAMAEVLAEAHLHAIGVKPGQVEDFLTVRDQLLRNLANESGRQSAFAVALALREARNSPDALEEQLAAAFRSLGFEVRPFGGKGEPDGVATALLPADAKGRPGRYAVTLEAKSKATDKGKVAAATVNVSAVARHRDSDKYKCDHALVVGRAFPGDEGSALANEIDKDRASSEAQGERKTITLITIDDLAKLVRLRPVKQLGLRELRGLFECRLPEESAAWVERLGEKTVEKPPVETIVRTIERLQKKRRKATVKYAALLNELSHLTPPIEYETDEELIEVCKAMAQMAPRAMFAFDESVEIDQSAENVIAAIEATMRDYPIGEQS